jgi:exosortase D (VPLPA-CTERM-specific)
MPKSLNSSIPKLLKVALFGLLLTALYYSAFVNMIRQWDKPEYNYCYLIPLVVLYLIWDKRERLAAVPSYPSWKGMIPLGFGIAFFWLGELGGEYLTLYMSFWLVLVGLCLIHMGWQKTKTIAFALFMMVTMFPLPYFFYNKISVKLQLISSRLGVSLMQLLAMPAYREGNVIDLGFTQLQVVEACSGLRSLISLIVLGLLMAYFFRASLWKRVFLVISTVPLSILANSARIALTGVLYKIWGGEVAEGFFHGFSGLVVFIFAFMILLLEMWVLRRVRAPVCLRTTGLELPARQEKKPLEPPASNFQPPTRKGLQAFFQPQSLVATVLLALTLALSQAINFREKTPIIKAFESFPLQVGTWVGTRGTMDQTFIDTLNLSDYVIVDYRNPAGHQVNLYVAYYESQRKGESIHSPGTCLPGSGWLFREAGASTVSIPGPNSCLMTVNRAYMEKLGNNQLCYYWFPQRGRILYNAYQLKLYAFWDALTRQRTDGALVRLITPISAHERLDQADARLRAFTRLIVPVLAEYIPGEDVGIKELRN